MQGQTTTQTDDREFQQFPDSSRVIRGVGVLDSSQVMDHVSYSISSALVTKCSGDNVTADTTRQRSVTL